MQTFLQEGYVAIRVDAGAIPLHEEVCERLDAVLEAEGNPTNNLVARVPAVQQVLDHPAVRGALTSLLGEGSVLGPHRYVHTTKPPSGDGGWHKVRPAPAPPPACAGSPRLLNERAFAGLLRRGRVGLRSHAPPPPSPDAHVRPRTAPHPTPPSHMTYPLLYSNQLSVHRTAFPALRRGLYYPHEVTEANGPTAILPQRHAYESISD
eukprot:COSAG04_NODE_2362_length_4267_cov_3.208973_1_plen_206_part_10